MDTGLRDRESEISKVLGWLNQANLETVAAERLALCTQARQKHEWSRAVDLGWQVINQAKSSPRISGNIDSEEGQGRMQLGAVYYVQADFAQALDHFDHAALKFSFDSTNQHIAYFARGAACARCGDRAGFDQSMTPSLIAVLRTAGARGVEELAKNLESNLTKNIRQTSDATAKDPDSLDSIQKQLRSLKRHAITPAQNPPQPSSTGAQVFLGGVIALILAAGAFAVTASTQTTSALILYFITWGLASFLLVRGMKYVIPSGHALVIEKSDAPRVAWGPNTCYLWPMAEKGCALVPLGPLQYTSPAKVIALTADESITIRVFVYYGISSTGQSDQNVLNAVYYHYADVKPAKESQKPARGKAAVLDVKQIRQKWESRLLNDIVMTLNEVLPGWSRQKLAGDESNARIELINWLHTRLGERVREWGMVIEDLNIIELSRAK